MHTSMKQPNLSPVPSHPCHSLVNEVEIYLHKISAGGNLSFVKPVIDWLEISPLKKHLKYLPPTCLTSLQDLLSMYSMVPD